MWGNIREECWGKRGMLEKGGEYGGTWGTWGMSGKGGNVGEKHTFSEDDLTARYFLSSLYLVYIVLK